MPSSGMLRRVNLVRIDVSKELSASIIRVTDDILHIHRRGNLTSYIILIQFAIEEYYLLGGDLFLRNVGFY
jgi:hypothetical protein